MHALRTKRRGLTAAVALAIATMAMALPATASAVAPAPDCSNLDMYELAVPAGEDEQILDLVAECDNDAGVHEIVDLASEGPGTFRLIGAGTEGNEYDLIGYTAPESSFTGRVLFNVVIERGNVELSANPSVHVMSDPGDVHCSWDYAEDTSVAESNEWQELYVWDPCLDEEGSLHPGDGTEFEALTAYGHGATLANLRFDEVDEGMGPGTYGAYLLVPPYGHGEYTFSFRVTKDGASDVVHRRFFIEESTPGNQPASCYNPAASFHHSHGATASIDLAAICGDPDGDELTFSAAPEWAPMYGTLSFPGGGNVTWTPTAGPARDYAGVVVSDGTYNEVQVIEFSLWERADLSVSLAGNATGTVGSPMSFTATATNDPSFPSAEKLTRATMTFELPPDATAGPAPAGCELETYAGHGSIYRWYTCSISDLAVGASVVRTFTFTPGTTKDQWVYGSVNAISGQSDETTWANDWVEQKLSIAVAPVNPPAAPPKDTTPPVIDLKKVIVKPVVTKIVTFVNTQVFAQQGDKVENSLEVSLKDAQKLGLVKSPAKGKERRAVAKPKVVVLGKGSAVAKKTGLVDVKVKLNAKSKKALKKTKPKSLNTTLTVKVTDPAGNVTIKKKAMTIKFKAPKAKKKK